MLVFTCEHSKALKANTRIRATTTFSEAAGKEHLVAMGMAESEPHAAESQLPRV